MSTIPWSIIRDHQRLDELRSLNIMNTVPEQSYDDLAEVARSICNAPISNITFVTADRQWFKSHIGSATEETSIEQSICAHVIGADDALIINDLRDDVRTKTNTLVTGPEAIRFYAGVSLRLDAKFGVGTLCVIDTKPHPNGLSQTQIYALQALGRQAVILLRVRQFLVAKNEAVDTSEMAGEPLDDLSKALIAAYELSKIYKDSVVENLISSSLVHIAVKIGQSENTGYSTLH